jgi:hypothetical protein
MRNVGYTAPTEITQGFFISAVLNIFSVGLIIRVKGAPLKVGRGSLELGDAM